LKLLKNTFVLKKTNENKKRTVIPILLKASDIGMLKATINSSASNTVCNLF
jgi:hypothetical protein